ncbi:MAG: DNA polymerase Y family protein [Chitinophagaceae bacterium]
MRSRFVSIWFPFLLTDWYTVRQPELCGESFVLTIKDHGKIIINAANAIAQQKGIEKGMALADARAIFPALIVKDEPTTLSTTLLQRMAEWCIRFTPIAAVDLPGGLILNASGCCHLWGGEHNYVTEIYKRFKQRGYTARIAMADTIGAAWAIAHFTIHGGIIESGKQATALLLLPPEALRLEPENIERLYKLGMRQIQPLLSMPRQALFRRFGPAFMEKLQQALGEKEEYINGVQPLPLYYERLPCLEPIATATGIEMALQRLLDALCLRLQQEGQGLRKVIFKGYCIDGSITEIATGTLRPTQHAAHLFTLFTIQLPQMAPGPGIELFILEAPVTEKQVSAQNKLWSGVATLDDPRISELLDRLAGKFGPHLIQRYIPDPHYWPERSYKPASLEETVTIDWYAAKPRPLQLLSPPEPIQVTAPIPDYPPLHFRYKDQLHTIRKADGPERIEQEWWLQQGQHRDYYAVEDEKGKRYWIFRLGHYDADKTYQWFIHGFFA